MKGRRIVKPIPYPHVAISDFIGSIKEYLIGNVYPNFGYAMIGSFDKAIQFIDQMNNDGMTSEHGMMNYYPFIVFTPTLEEPDRYVDYMWNYAKGMPFLNHSYHDPVLFEDGNILTVLTRRMKGNIDLRIFCESQMEEHDIQMAFLNMFKGLNTYTVLNNIQEYFILDQQIRGFTDRREEVVLDLANSNIERKLIQSTNKMEYVIPISAAPLLMLTALSDASSFYGGSGLTEYALTGSIAFELDIPSNITLETDMEIIDITPNIDVKTTSK